MVRGSHYVRECPNSQTLQNISFLLLHNPELDHQVLDEHADCILIFVDEGNDDVCMFHGWFDKVLVCRFDEAVVLD